MQVALHGMYSDGNFAFRRKMKKTLIRNSASLSQLKEMQKKKKERKRKQKKNREEKRREIIAGRFSASDEVELKADS